jgi:hypothetical protein
MEATERKKGPLPLKERRRALIATKDKNKIIFGL